VASFTATSGARERTSAITHNQNISLPATGSIADSAHSLILDSYIDASSIAAATPLNLGGNSHSAIASIGGSLASNASLLSEFDVSNVLDELGQHQPYPASSLNDCQPTSSESFLANPVASPYLANSVPLNTKSSSKPITVNPITPEPSSIVIPSLQSQRETKSTNSNNNKNSSSSSGNKAIRKDTPKSSRPTSNSRIRRTKEPRIRNRNTKTVTATTTGNSGSTTTATTKTTAESSVSHFTQPASDSSKSAAYPSPLPVNAMNNHIQTFSIQQQQPQRIIQQSTQQQSSPAISHGSINSPLPTTVNFQMQPSSLGISNTSSMLTGVTNSNGNDTSTIHSMAVNAPWAGNDKIFNLFIHDYLVKRGWHRTANTFIEEAAEFLGEVGTEDNLNTRENVNNKLTLVPPIDVPYAFMFEWWSLFWDTYSAATKRGGSNEAQAFLEVLP
jgi:hypothetical protein